MVESGCKYVLTFDKHYIAHKRKNIINYYIISVYFFFEGDENR